MEDKMDGKKESAVLCTCGGHCYHFGIRHMLLRKVLMILALIIVFGLGIKLGELKSEFRSFHGYGSYGIMRPYNNYGYGSGPGMMQNWVPPTTPTNPNPVPTPATPAQ